MQIKVRATWSLGKSQMETCHEYETRDFVSNDILNRTDKEIIEGWIRDDLIYDHPPNLDIEISWGENDGPNRPKV